MIFLRATVLLLVALAGHSTALLKPRAGGAEITRVPTTTLVKRVDPSRSSFYACDEAQWGGRCQWFQMAPGECLNFPLLWTDRISSFGPDPGYTCKVYRDNNCDDGSNQVKSYQYPGIGNLKDEEGDWNDQISSVKCELADSVGNQVAGPDPGLITSTTLTTLYVGCTTVTVNPRATYVLDKRPDDGDGQDFCRQ